MRLYNFDLMEGYREARAKFQQSADPELVDEIVNQFRDLVTRNQVKAEQKNIDWWAKQGWERFYQFVSTMQSAQSQTQRKKKRRNGESITLEENDRWLVVIPLDKTASCFYGKNTSWCTTKPEDVYFNHYFHRDEIVLVYAISKVDGSHFAAALNLENSVDNSYFNVDDDIISDTMFEKETGIDINQLIKRIETDEKIQSKIKNSRGDYTSIQNKIKEIFDVEGYEDTIRNLGNHPELEQLFLKTEDFSHLRRYIKDLMNLSTAKIIPLAPPLRIRAISISPGIIFRLDQPIFKEKVRAVFRDENLIVDIKFTDRELFDLHTRHNVNVLNYIDQINISDQLIDKIIEYAPTGTIIQLVKINLDFAKDYFISAMDMAIAKEERPTTIGYALDRISALGYFPEPKVLGYLLKKHGRKFLAPVMTSGMFYSPKLTDQHRQAMKQSSPEMAELLDQIENV